MKFRQRNGWRNICFLFLLCFATTATLPAQTFTNLVTFNSTNGSTPEDSLIQGVDGNLYGTTLGGGTSFPVAGGAAFKMTTAGNLTTLYNFCAFNNGFPCSDGYIPVAGLTLGADGNSYGTTSGGGTSNWCRSGCGTIFKLTSDGALTTLYSLCDQAFQQCFDGANPFGSLVQGVNGALYGTTLNASTVFEITPAGVFTVLHNFMDTDGSQLQSGLVLGKDGNFYGTATLGGLLNCSEGCGTIYKISPAGKFTVLYSFCAQGGNPCPDGENPGGGLVQGQDGNFYGTTSFGGVNGASAGGGTIFKITPSGTLTTLYSFCSQTNCADGAIPMVGALVQGTDGNFYGATQNGGHPGCVNYDLGRRGCGTLFQITPSGKLTTLYKFCHVTGCPDGALPYGGLFQATDGNFYGTTYGGGAVDCFGSTCGTVYRLSVGLGPFVSLQRPFGKVRQSVGILGQGLTGSSAVSFKGTSASFTVISDTYIRAQVPTGATTGTITVTTPSGTLNSNVPFHVLP